MIVIAQTLKYTVNKPQPNNNGSQSFPSDHTSATFHGAVFIQKRYRWKYGVPASAAANVVSWMEWSRIESESDKHDLNNVIAGIVIGTLSSYYFTTEYKYMTVMPYAESSAIGISLSMDQRHTEFNADS